MNLQVVFQNNKLAVGFTLIELLLVMSLMLIIGAIMAPVGISFYKSQALAEISENLTETMRRAQTYAISGKNDSSFGVGIFPNEFVLFEGESYLSRDVNKDEVFSIPETISVVGYNEIVFSELTGTPSEFGTITLSLGNRVKYIELTAAGNVEH